MRCSAAPDVAEREALRSQVRRWGSPGIWPAPERMPLGAALAADGTYRHATIGPADVYGSRFQAVLGRALEIVLGAHPQSVARRGVSGLDGRPARSRSGPGGVRDAGRWTTAGRSDSGASPAPAWRGPCRQPEVDCGQKEVRLKS